MASLTGLPMRLSISTRVSMVNLAVFFYHIGHARTGDHQNLDGLSLFQVVVRNPGREFFHQLLFQKPRIIDLFEGRSLKTLGLVRLKTQFQKEVHPRLRYVAHFGIDRHLFAFLAVTMAR